MRVIGFSFSKISVERLKEKMEKLKINTKINIEDLKEAKNDFLKTKEDIVEAKFNYSIFYDPDFAKIEIEGKILFAVDPKVSKDILKQWKDKKVPQEFETLFNIILRKSTIKALQLEEEMNLPLHIALPSVRKQENNKQ